MSAATVSVTRVSAATVPGNRVPVPSVSVPAPEHLLSARVRSLSNTAPYAVGAVPAGTIKLISGGPAVDALPVADLAAAAREVLGDPTSGAAALSYGPHAGIPQLREWIARRENTDPNRVLVTNGALHGVALTIAALVEPGDVIVVEDPVFPDTVRIAEQYGARVVPVRVGPGGLDVDQLADLLAAGERVRVVYTVPDSAACTAPSTA
jgi:2-aminoadipate transaminase